MFVPDEKHQTLAIIGASETYGPHIPIWEMQTRVAAGVFSGRCVLPDREKMLEECVARETLWTKNGRSKEKFLYGVSEFESEFLFPVCVINRLPEL